MDGLDAAFRTRYYYTPSSAKTNSTNTTNTTNNNISSPTSRFATILSQSSPLDLTFNQHSLHNHHHHHNTTPASAAAAAAAAAAAIVGATPISPPSHTTTSPSLSSFNYTSRPRSPSSPRLAPITQVGGRHQHQIQTLQSQSHGHQQQQHQQQHHSPPEFNMNPAFTRLSSSSSAQSLDRLLLERSYGNGSVDSFYNENGGGLTFRAKEDPGRRDHARFNQQQQPSHNGSAPSHGPQSQPGTAKRGSRACVACRKGKNRCESDPSGTQSCRRCLLNGIQCVYEKVSDRRDGRARAESNADQWSGEAEGRVSNLEKSVRDLANGQTQIQNALQQILAILPQSTALPTPTSLPTFLPSTDSVVPIPNVFHQSATPPSVFSNASPSVAAPGVAVNIKFPPVMTESPSSPQNTASDRRSEPKQKDENRKFPKLPGFAPPNHRFGTYGIIPLSSAPPSPSHSRHSSRSSSAHSVSSDAALPQSSMGAPIQALQALANAADQAAALVNGPTDDIPTEETTRHTSSDGPKAGQDGDEQERGRTRKRKQVTIDGHSIHLRVKKKTKPDPTPRNPFPDVVTKGLVSDTEARELWDIFFSGCHYFVPLWDKKYDTYETFLERTPFSTNGLLAVAAKIRAGNGPLGQTFHRCLEEAQGIARSTLFGPIVRKEAVMAMLILSVWSQNGWLPCGHALRMGLDMNLHRALDKLADSGEERSEIEERDLGSAWEMVNQRYFVMIHRSAPLDPFCEYTHQGHWLIFSTHPMVSETDTSLVARVELVNIRIRTLDHLTPLHGKIDDDTIAYVNGVLIQLKSWHDEWTTAFRARGYHDDSVLVRLLEVDLVYAQVWTVCVALRGCPWDKLSEEQKQLAFQGKDAAIRCLQIFLQSSNFRAHLKYATHEQLVSAAFSAVFLLKIAMLYPNVFTLSTLNSQVSELAHVLSSECFAERYALTLKLMLAHFRRKTGALSTVPGTPKMGGTSPGSLPNIPGINGSGAVGDLDGGLQSLLSLPQMGGGDEPLTDGLANTEQWPMFGDESNGFAWPTEFSPSNLPTWLQDNSMADLGLPADGSDSLFLPLELANMFLPSGTTSNAMYQFALPDSADGGGEAW